MDSQQTSLDFSKLFGPDLTSERNVESPLVQGAKILCACGCEETTNQGKWKHSHWNKNKTYEEIYGEERAREIKGKISKKIKGKSYIELYGQENTKKRIENHIMRRKDKTLEEIYGEQRAKEIKEKHSRTLRGKTYIQRFGENKAKQIKKNMSQSLKGRTYEQLYGKELAEKLKSYKREWRSKLTFPNKDNKIEIKIQDYLKQLGISFFTHQYLNQIEHAYQCDIWVPAMNLIIECDGDYWHAHPDKYKDEDLDDRQRLQKEKDVIRTSELIEQGFKVLRLWEKEIKVMDINNFKERLYIS